MTLKHSHEDYISYDPFLGDESEIVCRTIKIRKANKQHTCFGLDGNRNHSINPGEFYRFEKALIDGSFWGEFKICLNCMDQLMDEQDDGDD
jgi:hypothetical protein